MTNSTTQTQICKTCGEEKAMTEYYANKNRKQSHRSTCKDCEKAKKKNHYHTGGGKEERAAYVKTDAGKAAAARGQEKYRKTDHGKAVKAMHHSNYYKTEAGKASRAQSSAKYYATVSGKAKMAEKSAARRARERDAVDSNMSVEEKRQITNLYAKRNRMNKKAGYIAYHIDHIVALVNGGQHTISNLQILDAIENMSKGAK